jgi:hypothetical protein
MPDDETPPVRKLVLKAKDITPTDSAARVGDGTAISVRLMHKVNELAEGGSGLRGTANPELGAPAAPPGTASPSPFARKDIDLTDAPAQAADGTAISASLILKQNRMAEERHAPELIAMPPRRRSKRARDFILMEALALLLVAALVLALPTTAGSFIFGLFLFVFVSATLAWIIFGVMDDY